jgi:SAM-dependent methyltransferase
MFPDHFYRAFENTHRGSRELIRQRLLVYLPFVKSLAALSPDLPVLDIGCGRGEWLELMNDHGIAARGVDIDNGMLTACLERGLDAVSVDALAHLASLPNGSLLAVTGFHIAEHLPFASLQSLFAQAFRVLVPGGLLILETPNPENLLVGSANFYIDPSHQRPLPSQLLSFLAEHQGFSPVRLLRLQEEERLAVGGAASLYDVLANVSPDYAIVAQLPFTSASPSMERQSQALQLTRAFDVECGVSLPTLASRYDHQQQLQAESLLQTLEHKSKDSADQLDSLSQALDGKFKDSADQLDLLRHKLDSLRQTIEGNSKDTSDQVSLLKNVIEKKIKDAFDQGFQLAAHVHQLDQHLGGIDLEIQQTQSQMQQFLLDLAAINASRSWRITQPLRWLGRFLRRISGKS